MTFSPDLSNAIKSQIGEMRGKWAWFVGLGVLLLIVGGIAFGNLMVATVASVYFVGFLMLMAGIFEIAHAFGVKSWGGFFWWLFSGLLYAFAGIVALSNPLLASTFLTLILAASLFASGILRAWIGYQHRAEQGAAWVIVAGIVSALTGLIIALGWPVNSLWILGLFLAIDLVFQGVTFIAFGLALKK